MYYKLSINNVMQLRKISIPGHIEIPMMFFGTPCLPEAPEGCGTGGEGVFQLSALKYATELEGEIGNDCFPSGKRLRDRVPGRQYTCFST